jgi:hypothetical protein
MPPQSLSSSTCPTSTPYLSIGFSVQQNLTHAALPEVGRPHPPLGQAGCHPSSHAPPMTWIHNNLPVNQDRPTGDPILHRTPRLCRSIKGGGHQSSPYPLPRIPLGRHPTYHPIPGLPGDLRQEQKKRCRVR